MRYYISDLHFFHERMNRKLDKRGFESVEAMNKHMIEMWNKRVKKNDEVVILGDFSYGNANETMEVLKQLKGRKMLVKGNHDKYLLDKNFDQSLFVWIKDYAELNDNKRKVILCHYPIMCYNGQFRKDENGKDKTYMLFGHVHASKDNVGIEWYKSFIESFPRESRKAEKPTPAPIHLINTFCMLSDYTPLTLDEWIKNDADGGVLKKLMEESEGDKNGYLKRHEGTDQRR